MNVDNLVNMFSQKSGIQQSVIAIIIPLIIQFITQKLGTGGARGFFSGGKKGGMDNISSALSELGNINSDHPLVKEVQDKANIQDPQQVTQYIHQAADLMKQEATNNPQGIESLFGNVPGGVGGDTVKGIGEKVKGFFGK